MKKKILFLLLCAALLGALAVPAAAADEKTDSFVLTVVTANGIIIDPSYISYTGDQTIREALLASGHTFTGLESGYFIEKVNNISGTFYLFYDGGKHDLSVPASEIRTLCIGETSQYSENLLDLIRDMAQCKETTAYKYPDVQAAYKVCYAAIRNGDADAAKTAHDQLKSAIDDYQAKLNGTRYTVTVTASQGAATLTDPHITLCDVYGNITTSNTGSSASVVAGEYSFVVSDGGYNRTEGAVTVSEDTALSVTLPSGEWFGDVKILDANKNAYPYAQDTTAHTAVFQIPDTAKELSSLYLNVGQGAVPDKENTRLRTIYIGTDGRNFSAKARSWESIDTALTYLIVPGMEEKTFPLEAQYTDSNGHTQIQSYSMTIERTPTLASLTVTADGTVLPVAFDPLIGSYDVVTVSDTLDIAASSFGADYTIQGTGPQPVSKHITVSVSHGGKTTDYTLNITRKDSVAVKLTAEDGVTVQVQNAAGSVIAPVDGVYPLIPGESYTYTATKNTWYHTKQSFTAAEGLAVSVATPVTEDWLTDLALYNGSNASNRKAYPADSSFVSTDHNYVYQISDCNTTAYIQTTSDYTTTALYSKQTTVSATHREPMSKTVGTSVSDTGDATALSRAVARSGYSNSVTLQISDARGDVTYYQEYSLTLARVLHAYTMALADADGALVLLDSTGKATKYDRDVTGYSVTVNRDVDKLTLSGTFPNPSGDTDCCGGYYVQVNDTRFDTLDNIPIALDSEKTLETVAVQVCHENKDAIPTTYTVTVKKTDPVAITFGTTPSDAVVCLINDLNGKRVLIPTECSC